MICSGLIFKNLLNYTTISYTAMYVTTVFRKSEELVIRCNRITNIQRLSSRDPVCFFIQCLSPLRSTFVCVQSLKTRQRKVLRNTGDEMWVQQLMSDSEIIAAGLWVLWNRLVLSWTESFKLNWKGRDRESFLDEDFQIGS